MPACCQAAILKSNMWPVAPLLPLPLLLPLLLLLLCAAPAARGATSPSGERMGAGVPLTEIDATSAELEAFAATLAGAIAKLQLPPLAVVHLLGASAVEAAVDWTPVCEAGATLVLVGPQAVAPPGGRAGTDRDSCVHTVVGLYSREAVRAGLEGVAGVAELATELAVPDAVVLHNSDLYMPYWRRTLAELLQLEVPVVHTMYCEYEGHKMERLLNWPEIEFTPQAFADCDRLVAANFGGQAVAEAHSAGGGGSVPEPRLLWSFEPNPHAHAPPRNCYRSVSAGTVTPTNMTAAPSSPHKLARKAPSSQVWRYRH